MAAVRKFGGTLEYASDELKCNKEVVLAAVQNHGWALEYASNELKNDKEVVLAAVRQNGSVLEYASDELRNDKEVVVAAVQKDGRALYYASEELRKDREIVLISIANHVDACECSLLKGYQNFEEVITKEGETFLFSCWNNIDWKTRLRVTSHPNFLPTLEQINIVLNNKNELNIIKETCQLRKDEWLAKIEENKLRNTI